MLSSISISSVNPVFAPPCETSAIHLTESEVLAETKSISPGRFKGELFWVEHMDVAALNYHIEFINTLIDKIHLTTPIKETPVTIIFLGSNALLTEFYIHQQLHKAGYKDISWRFIDTVYKGYSHAFFEQFKVEATSN